MGQPQLQVVTEFKGLSTGIQARNALSSRRNLDSPRELKNFLVTEEGYLWMPPGADEVYYDYPTGGAVGTRVKRLAHVRSPGVMITQIGDEIWEDDGQNVGTLDDSPTLLYTMPAGKKEADDNEMKRPVWVVSLTGSGQASGSNETFWGHRTGTWKYDGATVTDLSASVPNGTHSIVYKGRRFVGAIRSGGGEDPAMVGLRSVAYSDLNDIETFQATSYFVIDGDVGGGQDHAKFTGGVTGFAVWEDLLVIFCSQSIWVLNGSDPDTFNLRRTSSTAGCLGIETVVEVEQGLMFFGGTPEGETGVYLFTGNSTQLVSGPITSLFREWDADSYEVQPTNASGNQTNRNKHEDDVEWYFSAMRWQNHYILSGSEIQTAAGDPQIYAMNLLNGKWSTFTGWGSYPRLGYEKKYYHPYVGLVDDDGVVYRFTRGFPRDSAEDATVVTGWSDSGNPNALYRFMGLKVNGWYSGSGTAPTLTVTVTTDRGGTTTDNYTLTDDIFDGALLPINLRGSAIEIQLDISPNDDSQEVLIESMTLMISARSEKLSRV